MGMFDSIEVESVCPHCKQKVIFDMQTKAGPKWLHNYHIGDKFNLNSDAIERQELIKKLNKKYKPSINLLGSCKKCRCMLHGFAFLSPKPHIIKKIKIYNYSIDVDIVIDKNGQKDNY